ncbi:MAG: histidinol dehydrogenase [Bacteroidota bacterium]|nr:histidinol dehydrogenase [Bacteroidota bacterium]MDP3146620.1 histidinol dehydrogenase [Bacteroidota bacterium]
METINYPPKNEWSKLLQRPTIDTISLEQTVNDILVDVQKNGDIALAKYTLQYDKATIAKLLASEVEFEQAEKLCSQELKAAIQLAKSNIEKFHKAQKEEIKIIETSDGVNCWRKSVGIEKVGLYIPGGSAPLFSTILMLGIPAKLAGCKEIILCSPPDKNGNLNPAILYAAKLVGVTKLFKIGGVQAIAAMAYGTESVPKVYKIFGPGNQYVTCAKQLVNKNGTAIDMPAGPSELAVIADETCVPEFVAADLLSQAEHGEDSQVILISTNEKIISKIKLEVYKQLEVLPRKEIAAKALENSTAFLVKDVSEAIQLINEYAPEHLIIACENDEVISEQIINAGSIFLGNYSCESAGDYASGTNHALPTNGNAKAYSGVSLDSFVKKITMQKITQEGINKIGPAIEVMAEAEGLQAHKNAVTIRLKK